MQSEVSIEPRDERDITETEHMLALVGVAQPASVYRLDVHRWTVTPLANKLLPSDSSSAPSNGTIPSNGNSGVVDEDPAEPGEGLKISNSANRVPSQEVSSQHSLLVQLHFKACIETKGPTIRAGRCVVYSNEHICYAWLIYTHV